MLFRQSFSIHIDHNFIIDKRKTQSENMIVNIQTSPCLFTSTVNKCQNDQSILHCLKTM